MNMPMNWVHFPSALYLYNLPFCPSVVTKTLILSAEYDWCLVHGGFKESKTCQWDCAFSFSLSGHSGCSLLYSNRINDVSILLLLILGTLNCISAAILTANCCPADRANVAITQFNNVIVSQRTTSLPVKVCPFINVCLLDSLGFNR